MPQAPPWGLPLTKADKHRHSLVIAKGGSVQLLKHKAECCVFTVEPQQPGINIQSALHWTDNAEECSWLHTWTGRVIHQWQRTYHPLIFCLLSDCLKLEVAQNLCKRWLHLRELCTCTCVCVWIVDREWLISLSKMYNFYYQKRQASTSVSINQACRLRAHQLGTVHLNVIHLSTYPL